MLLFQGPALVSRAEADRDRLHAGIDAALDALRDPRIIGGEDFSPSLLGSGARSFVA